MAQPCRLFNIGIEMECLLGIENVRKIPEEDQSADTYYKTYKRIADGMNTKLNHQGFLEVYDKTSPQSCDYKSWVLKFDSSVAGKPHHAPVEIVSPILWDRGNEEIWNLPVKRIFWAMDGVKTNDTCGTHFHLSPVSDTWTLEDLKQLSYCILYFEKAFEHLYSTYGANGFNSEHEERERRTQENPSPRAEYVKANWSSSANRKFRRNTFEENVDAIRKKKTIWDLAILMNAVEHDEADPEEYRYYENQFAENAPQVDRNYAWNFKNLQPENQERKQTV
ncbi:hypothetical protein MMC07_007806 [Pseudocyphellaria aurata]|nr:hypothetical protein [Pseudocyphellaria aurata]